MTLDQRVPIRLSITAQAPERLSRPATAWMRWVLRPSSSPISYRMADTSEVSSDTPGPRKEAPQPTMPPTTRSRPMILATASSGTPKVPRYFTTAESSSSPWSNSSWRPQYSFRAERTVLLLPVMEMNFKISSACSPERASSSPVSSSRTFSAPILGSLSTTRMMSPDFSVRPSMA